MSGPPKDLSGYVILSSDNLGALCDLVDQYLLAGFSLVGGVSVSHRVFTSYESVDSSELFAQAMVKQ